MRVYYLLYEFGMHHVWIRVSHDMFEKVLADMSTEFEIHKEVNIDDFSITNVWVTNYWGDRQDIAYYQEILPSDNDKE